MRRMRRKERTGLLAGIRVGAMPPSIAVTSYRALASAALPAVLLAFLTYRSSHAVNRAH